MDNQYLTWVLEGASVALSTTLRYRAVSFVRWNPWGVRLLESIFGLWALSVVLWLAQYLTQRKPLEESQGKHQVSRALLVILLGRYDSAVPAASLVSIVLNSLFALAAFDFVYRARILHPSLDLSFSRMGYTDRSTAKIVIRYPEATCIQIQYRSTSDGEHSVWQKGETECVNANTDYVTTFTLADLQQATEYEYRSNASHSGTFKTPAADLKRWTMVSTSCMLPFYPYNPLDHSLSMKGLDHLSRYLRRTEVDMMLFLGDFIYIDLPTRFGFETKDYQDAFRQVYASPSWSKELLSLPWIHAYDDHEITNNWSSNETGIYQQAIAPFMTYQHDGNPEPVRPGATYYSFTHGDVSIFVLDTRRYRSLETLPDGEEKSMLGPDQLRDFESWLRQPSGWKVVLSSVPFTRNYRSADYVDTWAGYLWERQKLLELMWETEGVLILSGDRHEHSTTAFPRPGTNDSNVIEFSTSPLNQFIPAGPDYFQREDSDVGIHYVRVGDSKFGSITFDTSDENTWHAEFELIVDGVKTWSYTVHQDRRQRAKM